MLVRDLAALTDVRHGDRLAAVGVAGDGHNDVADLALVLGKEAVELLGIHVALEGVLELAVIAGCGQQILRPHVVLHRGAAGGVERHIGHDVLVFRVARVHHARQQKVGGAPLMRGNDEREAGHVLNGRFKPVKALAAGIGLVAHHNGRPLLVAHGGRTGVGQAVDVNVFRFQLEHVPRHLLQCGTAMLRRRRFQHFHGLDAEGLGILVGLHRHNHILLFIYCYFKFTGQTTEW